jgi:rod shape-determining protein MreC
MKHLKLFIPIIVSIFLILSDYKFSYLDNLRQFTSTLISPIYFLVNLPSQLYIWIDEQGTNKQVLLNQNKKLNSELMELKVKLQPFNSLILENSKLSKLLESSYSIDSPEFTLAKITSISQSRLKKQLIINKGSKNNVKVGQVVFGADGIVGQVTNTTPFYSTIILISDPTHYIPVKNERNGVRGIGKGKASNSNTIIVNYVESKLDVLLGDIFISSSIDSKFPHGYPVGKVIHVEKQTNNPFLDIVLEPTQNTNNIEFILILKQDNEN